MMPKFNADFSLGNALSMLTTLIAIGALVWHMSAALADLRSVDRDVERRLAVTERQVSQIDREARDFGNRMARIEEKSSTMLGLLQSIEQRLERVLNGRRTDVP